MAVACGSDFTVLLTEHRGVLFFGSGVYRQLEGFADELRVAPCLVGGWDQPVGDAGDELPGGKQAVAALARIEGALGPPQRICAQEHLGFTEEVVMVAAGFYVSVCVTESGAVFATGIGEYGNLGLGDVIGRSSFARLGPDAFGSDPAMMVACGDYHTLVLTRTGLVWAFGSGLQGQNANPGLECLFVPTLVAGLDDMVMVAAANNTSVALGADGRVWTWGSSRHGALGHGDTGDEVMAIPRALDLHAFGGNTVLFVAAGCMYTMAVTARGDLWAWGAGESGQLGLGDVADRRVPTRLTNTWDGSRVRMVSCGCTYSPHTMAATEDGAVWTWGSSHSGQLGLNDLVDRATPTRIPQTAFGGAHVVLVHNSRQHVSMAVTRHGLVYQWGLVVDGHQPGGLGTSRVPVPLGSSLSREGRCGHSCAVRASNMLAFASGTHARLGEECVFRGLVEELFTCINEQAQAPGGAYAHMREGQLRLLAATVRVT